MTTLMTIFRCLFASSEERRAHALRRSLRKKYKNIGDIVADSLLGNKGK